MALLQRVARLGGLPAHARLQTERQLRDAAGTLRMLGEERMAAELRTMAAKLGVQRRRIIARAQGIRRVN
jgi:hypothetical protein